MDAPDLLTALRVEKVRLAWDYAVREADGHHQRHLQLFAVAGSGAIAVLASVALEKIPLLPGLVVASLLFVAAGYAQLRIRQLPRRLRDAAEQASRAIDRLMWEREP